MNVTVLDSASLGSDLDLTPLSRFGNLTVRESTPAELLPEVLRNSECVVLNKVKLTSEAMKNAADLKLVCIAATGFDNVDVDYCRSHGIAVCNVAGYSTDSVAQITLCTALALVCRLREYTDYVRSGDYTRSGVPNRLVPVYHELSGMTWGVIGYGNIGRRVADIARAFGCRVLVCRKSRQNGDGYADVSGICRESDIISLHCPLNESTRGIIGREQLSFMKKTAVLINAARGAVCDENAVAEAILSGSIGGFGCDVYSSEPLPEDHPYQTIINHPSVCLTPHMAWGSYEARVRLVSMITDNISSFLSGGKLGRVDLK